MHFHFQKRAGIHGRQLTQITIADAMVKIITASQAVATETRNVHAISRALHLLRLY